MTSGADFPGYVRELVNLGVNYDTYVKDGHAEYNGKNGYTIQSDTRYPSKDIAAKSNSEQFKHYLKIHQQGKLITSRFANTPLKQGWKNGR